MAALAGAAVLAAALAAAAALSAPPVPAAPPPPADRAQDAELAREGASVKAVCGQCHPLQIVMDTPMSYEAWRETVQKMVDQGARGSDAQFDDIMDFLYRTMTTINVNTADADALAGVLDLPEAAVQAIIVRRKNQKIADFADLKGVVGADGRGLDARARLIFY